MSELEIGLNIFWLCLTFGFLTLLSVVVCLWQIKEREDDE